MNRLLAGLAVFLSSASAFAADATTRPASPQNATVTRQLEATVARATVAIDGDSKEAMAYQARAEALFRLGQIEASVKDFDRAVELAPESKPFNWQRGIALYYAGRFEDAARQFELHRTVNPEDVENAAWHYLCLSRALGVEKGPRTARKQLIPIREDRRVPLMKIHAMFAGQATPQEVIETANAGKPDAEDLRERLFYAHLYIGIYLEAQGDAKGASEHISEAATTFGVEGYMGDVARVHAMRIAAKPTTQPTSPKQ